MIFVVFVILRFHAVLKLLFIEYTRFILTREFQKLIFTPYSSHQIGAPMTIGALQVRMGVFLRVSGHSDSSRCTNSESETQAAVLSNEYPKKQTNKTLGLKPLKGPIWVQSLTRSTIIVAADEQSDKNCRIRPKVTQ